jgi:hypothetical protein
MSVNPYSTRSTQASFKELTMRQNLAAAKLGNKQVAALIEESKQDYSWKTIGFQVAKIASLAFLAGSMIYECYQLHKSTEDFFSVNIEYGKHFISTQVSGYVHQIANDHPHWKCYTGSQVIDLVSCYAQGLTKNT